MAKLSPYFGTHAGDLKIYGYPELMALMMERGARRVKTFMDTLHVIQKVGIDRAGILKMSEDASTIFMIMLQKSENVR